MSETKEPDAFELLCQAVMASVDQDREWMAMNLVAEARAAHAREVELSKGVFSEFNHTIRNKAVVHDFSKKICANVREMYRDMGGPVPIPSLPPLDTVGPFLPKYKIHSEEPLNHSTPPVGGGVIEGAAVPIGTPVWWSGKDQVVKIDGQWLRVVSGEEAAFTVEQLPRRVQYGSYLGKGCILGDPKPGDEIWSDGEKIGVVIGKTVGRDDWVTYESLPASRHGRWFLDAPIHRGITPPPPPIARKDHCTWTCAGCGAPFKASPICLSPVDGRPRCPACAKIPEGEPLKPMPNEPGQRKFYMPPLDTAEVSTDSVGVIEAAAVPIGTPVWWSGKDQVVKIDGQWLRVVSGEEAAFTAGYRFGVAVTEAVLRPLVDSGRDFSPPLPAASCSSTPSTTRSSNEEKTVKLHFSDSTIQAFEVWDREFKRMADEWSKRTGRSPYAFTLTFKRSELMRPASELPAAMGAAVADAMNETILKAFNET